MQAFVTSESEEDTIRVSKKRQLENECDDDISKKRKVEDFSRGEQEFLGSLDDTQPLLFTSPKENKHIKFTKEDKAFLSKLETKKKKKKRSPAKARRHRPTDSEELGSSSTDDEDDEDDDEPSSDFGSQDAKRMENEYGDEESSCSDSNESSSSVDDSENEEGEEEEEESDKEEEKDDVCAVHIEKGNMKTIARVSHRNGTNDKVNEANKEREEYAVSLSRIKNGSKVKKIRAPFGSIDLEFYDTCFILKHKGYDDASKKMTYAVIEREEDQQLWLIDGRFLEYWFDSECEKNFLKENM